MRKSMIGLMILSVALLGGCDSLSTREEGTLIGGLGGAGLGALIGASTGSWAWGAVIGAGAGALTGYVISDSIADEEEREAGRRGDPVLHSSEDAEAIARRNQARDYFNKAKGSMDDAESEYFLNKSIDLYPTAEAYNNLALIRLKNNDRAGAEAAWNKALNLDPGNRAARENLARMQST